MSEENQQSEVVLDKEIVVRLYTDGTIDLGAPEGKEQLHPYQIESILKNVCEKLLETRIQNQVVENIRQKLM